MEIVNGFPCFDCSDTARAKRGIDPADSPQAAANAAADKKADARADRTLSNDPQKDALLTEGPRGRLVNVVA